MTSSSPQATPAPPAMPTWREAFDAAMRPLAASAEAWVQTESFMNALAVTWRIQRHAARRFEDGLAAWLRLGGVPSRSDLLRLSGQVANVERQLRELTRALDERS